MKTTEKPKITSYCGLNCDICQYKKSAGCKGCAASSGKPFHGECTVAKCCISKGRQFCGDCADYPCEKLKTLAFDPEHGDNGQRLKNCDEIKSRLVASARNGLDPVAFCGFSCNHCFLVQWCGGCRSDYNLCSFATVSPDGVCPNVKCCKEKNYDGCWQCPELLSCRKGFYTAGNDGANACKAQALFIQKYGKEEFLKVRETLKQRNPDMKKIQEVLDSSIEEDLAKLEQLL